MKAKCTEYGNTAQEALTSAYEKIEDAVEDVLNIDDDKSQTEKLDKIDGGNLANFQKIWIKDQNKYFVIMWFVSIRTTEIFLSWP